MLRLVTLLFGIICVYTALNVFLTVEHLHADNPPMQQLGYLIAIVFALGGTSIILFAWKE